MVDGMTRKEHLAWCKQRALDYLDRGDLHNALSSMISDMQKHPENRRALQGGFLPMVGMLAVREHDATKLRYWIEGFN
jgi:hypothetical protein